VKRSSHSPRTASNLSESAQRRLNMYALAASAAGVGMLASTQPAEAKIIYTPAHHVIRERASYQLDLNHDRETDFTIRNLVTCNTDLCTYSLFNRPAKGNAGLGYGKGSGGFLLASALKAGIRIGPSTKFYHRRAAMVFAVDACVPSFCYVSGPWENVQNRYLGLRFKIKGQNHYGWARLDVQVTNSAIVPVLTGYAYETVPNKPIIAGKTKGSEDFTASQTKAQRFGTKASPTLGKLAIGSRGLLLGRVQ